MSKNIPKFQTYGSLIKNLRSKNMIIENETDAINLLKENGYYTLINRYKGDFYISNKSLFERDTSINDLYKYKLIETDFRNILFKYTIIFEQKLKESISYTLSKDIGIRTSDYLNPYNYRNKNKAKQITGFINKKIIDCHDDPVKYYKNHYNDIPPWVLVNNITLGQTRMLFSMFKFDQSDYVAQQLISPNKEIFSNNRNEREELIEFTRNIISIISDFRNTLAHGRRMVHFNSKTKLKYKSLKLFITPNVITKNEFYTDKLCTNDPFAFLVVLSITMKSTQLDNLIIQLKEWEKTNTGTINDKKLFTKFLSNSKIPQDFIQRLNNIPK
ncbi:Abi family protein [Companilactobacillus nodensis]|uniref:Abi family protein n=1 Tax=Companilactobacillus nodensis TaxID=460870 RepID=UPI00046836B8|nr:Abi family protein [Companilactobacillus nodensis]